VDDEFFAIGHCKGCKKPCFLREYDTYWEIGTVCDCSGRLIRGTPVTVLYKMLWTLFLLIIWLITQWHVIKLLLVFGTVIGLTAIIEYLKFFNPEVIHDVYKIYKDKWQPKFDEF